jgi:hypothetical protein
VVVGPFAVRGAVVVGADPDGVVPGAVEAVLPVVVGAPRPGSGVQDQVPSGESSAPCPGSHHTAPDRSDRFAPVP